MKGLIFVALFITLGQVRLYWILENLTGLAWLGLPQGLGMRFIITWTLHHIFMLSNKVKLAAG